MYERYGELPQDILEGTRRSNFAPPIIRGQQQTETDDHLDDPVEG